ncbi:response regulator [Chloroflexota bacterium]
MKKIRILVADDHAIVREGTCRVLQQEPDLEVVAEAGDGEEAVRLATEMMPDVALIDIVMPRLNGIEATKQIKMLCPTVAVLVLSAYDDDQFVFGLLQAGAAGYLLKSVHGRELVAAIRAVRRGEPVLHPSVMRKVLNQFSPDRGESVLSDGVEALSEREREVLKLAAKGLNNKDIAKELCLSLRTVQAHFTRVFRKLQVSSRTEAVLRGLREGWLSLGDVHEGKSAGMS